MKKQKKSTASKSAPKSAAGAPKTEVKTAQIAMSKIMPLGDRVLVRPAGLDASEEKNTFGIIIPETVNKEQPGQGEVIAVGEGHYENGKLTPVKVKVGDKVIFSKYAFDEVKDGDKDLYILKEENILAVIKK